MVGIFFSFLLIKRLLNILDYWHKKELYLWWFFFKFLGQMLSIVWLEYYRNFQHDTYIFYIGRIFKFNVFFTFRSACPCFMPIVVTFDWNIIQSFFILCYTTSHIIFTNDNFWNLIYLLALFLTFRSVCPCFMPIVVKFGWNILTIIQGVPGSCPTSRSAIATGIPKISPDRIYCFLIFSFRVILRTV